MKKSKNLISMVVLTALFLISWISCQQKADKSNQVLIEEITKQILEARSVNIPIPPVSKTHENISMKNAYAVQLKLSDELSKSYGSISGYKLGYSDSSSLKKNNISIPAYGPIFKNQIIKSGDTIQANNYRIFSIECEIVFTIAKTIEKKVSSVDELTSFVKTVHIGFDMSESIFDGQTTIADFVANGGDSKYFVLSEGLDPLKTDIADKTLSIITRDSVIYKGTTENVLGNPWIALRAVANNLVERGYPLKTGDVIFSGKVAPPYKMQSDMAEGVYIGVASSFPEVHVLVK